MVKFTLRLTEEEKQILDIKSKELNKSKNDILRYLINNNLIKIEDEIKIYEELNNNFKDYAFQLKKFGTVLNQINKNFYNGKNEKIENIDNILEELWQSIKL